MINNLLTTTPVDELYGQIELIVTEKKTKVAYQINNTMLETYFLIGKLIVENEQNGNIKAEYGKQVLKELSKRLTKRFGSGFSLSNMKCMRKFYLVYQKSQTVSGQFSEVQKFQPLAGKFEDKQKSQPAGQLSWSHYCYLISIEDDDERSFYEKECINSK